NDIRHMYSDHYEGTEFDLTKGVAAGPFGNPNRYLGPDDPHGDVGEQKNLKGAWERPICAYYTGYSYISQLRPDQPYPINLTSWVALNTPGESVFVPLAVAPLPEGYERADARAYDPDSYWWTYNLVGEWANLKYSYMIKDIRARAAAHESSSRKLLDDVRLLLAPLAKSNPEQALAEYGKALGDNATRIRTDWQRFFHELAAKYAQGGVNTPEKMAGSVGYPKDWLDATDYSGGPTQYEKRDSGAHRD
ncbi:MAG: C69 family dipeptidase, partial [Desulfovibrio sp.]|nr:C69 family dipeptidase [Desulfovibrio sp.]